MPFYRILDDTGMEKWEQDNREELAHLTDIMHDLEKDIAKKKTLLELTKKERLLSIKHLISRKSMYNMLWYYAKENYGKKKGNKEAPIQDFLREQFEDDSIVFDTIRQGGWTGYYWDICFSSGDKKFQLTVPTTEMKVEDLEHSSDGKLSIARDKETVIEHFESSYNFEDIKAAYKKEIENEASASARQ